MLVCSVPLRAAETGVLLAQSDEEKTAAPARMPAVPKAENDTSPDVFGWTLPPLRWGGTLTTDLRMERAQDQPRRFQQNEIANIRASSYIWQPWFALVSGGLGLLMSKERSDATTGVPADRQRNSNSRTVTGNGELALFPVSRFPLNAYFDRSDSRASGDAIGNDFLNTRYGVRQSYQPVAGNANYAASFNRSMLQSPAFGRDTVNAFSASMNRTIDAHAFDVAGSHTRNTRSNTRESAALSQFTARHSYRPEPEFSVESLASVTGSDFDLLSSGVPSTNRSRFAQANSFATWRPDEDTPLYVSGGGRMFRALITTNAGETETLTLSGNVGAIYELSPQTRLSGSAAVTQLVADGRNVLLTTQTASATHVGDPRSLLGGVYTWNAGANLANQTGAPEGTRQNAGVQIGHNLSRSLLLPEDSQIHLAFGQGVASSYDTVTTQSQTLSHNASVSWRLTRNGTTSAYAGLFAADSRTSGYNPNQFQMINLQASGQVQFNRNSSAVANLTVQGMRQSTGSTPRAGFNLNTSGTLSYFHSRAFDVPRLRYTALYGINDTQFRTRLQGDVDAPRERVAQLFEQRFDYTIGRVAMRLSMRIADVEGRRDALLFFRLVREFGAF